jgi:uncharacterized protein YcnI
MLKTITIAAAALLLSSAAAFAHVTLEQAETPVGGAYKAILRIPHGCDGKATQTVRVRLPEGFFNAKPQPKAGWTLEKIRGAYAKTYDYYGTAMKEGLKEVVWSGGNLGDDEYDEFVVRGTVAGDLKPGDTLYFAVVQECAGDLKERWIEIPAAGKSSDDLEMPAPRVKLLEKAKH